MQVSTDNTKRRRTSSPNDDNILSLSTLPGDHLATVSSYLAPTSTLLLACALSAPSSSFRTVNWLDWKRDESLTNESKAILTSIGSTTEILDFGDVGDLASKLSDDDIAALLLCIDAKIKLKKLLLTGCKRIVGHGLESLCGSTVLECISLHLPMESLSTSVITPILDSIVDSDGNSLREIKVTNMKHAKNEPAVGKFLAKFNKLFSNGDKCEDCVDAVQRGLVGEDFEIPTASLTCFECFESLCGTCDNYSDYRMRTCSHCDLTFCGKCVGRSCYICNKFYCSECEDIDIVGAPKTGKYCDRCNYAFCINCIDPDRTRGRICECDGCRGVHTDALFARNKKQKEEINELKGEITLMHSNIGDLAEENEELRREIEELRKKMSPGLGILS